MLSIKYVMFFFLRLTATLGKFSHAADKIRQKKGKKKRLCKVQFFFGGIVLSLETILFRMLLIRVDQSLVFFDENNERPFFGNPITF